MSITSSSVINIIILKYFATNYANNLWKTSLKGKKTVLFKNKRSHNLETPKRINKNIGTLSEISLLMNYEEISSLSPKHWGS